MLKKIRLLCYICLFVLFSIIVTTGQTHALNVYAEGAYTDSDLHVYIYANINLPSPILSFGVKLTYNFADLTVSSTEKNEAVWYMGDKTTTGNNTYMEPDISVAGEIIFIGGKLDLANPTEGVSGDRVLLGKVIFTRNNTNIPSITLSLGRTTGKYYNFVAVDGTVLDGNIVFNTTIVQRGDANADGIVNFQDMLFVRQYTKKGGNYTPFADCNADGIINFQDMLCIKAITKR